MATNYGGAYVELIPKVAGDFDRRAASQLGPPLENATRGIGSKLGGILGGALALGGGLALGAGIKRFLSGAIDEARESNKVLAQTDAVIKSTASAAGVSADHVDTLANKLSGLTGIDDEVVASTENLLLTFTNIKKEGGIFDETTASVLDMSAALGQDTKSSAIQLGKALNDPVKGITALQRVGVTFTAQQKDQINALVASGKTMEAQKIILAEIKKEFGGSAAAIATPAQKMQVAWGNFKEAIGKAVIPLLNVVETKIAKVLPRASDIAVNSIAKLVSIGYGLAHTIDALVHGNFDEFEKELLKVDDRLGFLIPVFEKVRTVIADFFSGLIHGTDDLGSAQTKFAVFGASVRAIFEGIRSLLSGDTQGFAELVDNAFGNTGQFVGPLRDLGDAVVAAFDWLVKHPDVVEKFAIGLAGLLVAEKAATGINSVAKFAGDLPGKLNPANTELGKLVTNLGKVVSKTASVTIDGAQAAADQIGKVIDQLGNVKDKTVKITASVTEDVKNKGQGLVDRLTGFLSSEGVSAGLGAALGTAFGAIDIGALATSIGGTIAAGLAAVAASPVLVVAAVVLAVAAVAALAFAFRDELGHFFTDTLPSFIGDALGTLAAVAATLIIVVPVTIIETLVEWTPRIVEAIVGFIPVALEAIGNFFAALPGRILGFLEALPGLMVGALQALPGLVLGFFATLPELLLGILQRIPGYFAFVFTEVLPRIIITVLTGIPGLVLSFFTSIPDLIGGILGKVAEAFVRGWQRVNELTGGKLNEIAGTIGRALDGIVGFFSGLPGRIGGVLSNVFAPLWEGFRSFVNRIIRGWNSLHFGLPEFDTHIPGVGKVGGGSVGVPQIPLLDTGGSVSLGGLAVIDRAHELVTLPSGAKVEPLDGNGALAGGHFAIEIVIPLDGRELVRRTIHLTAEELENYRVAHAS